MGHERLLEWYRKQIDKYKGMKTKAKKEADKKDQEVEDAYEAGQNKEKSKLAEIITVGTKIVEAQHKIGDDIGDIFVHQEEELQEKLTKKLAEMVDHYERILGCMNTGK